MTPGQHQIVLGSPADAIRARAQGWSLRDTLALNLPGPATQFAFLFRAPLEGTVAETVLREGQGALWVDGCRVGTTKEVPGSTNVTKSLVGFGERPGRKGRATGDGGFNPNLGRWPTNLLLVHSPGCQQVGEKQVRGSGKDSPAYRGNGSWSGDTFAQDNWTKTCWKRSAKSHVDQDGSETVASWQCEDGCPVAALDEQSGICKGAYVGNPEGGAAKYGIPLKNPHRGNTYGAGLDTKPCGVLYSDTGTASRFFPQLQSLSEAIGWLTRLTKQQEPPQGRAPLPAA